MGLILGEGGRGRDIRTDMDIVSYLLKSEQRLGKYSLLFRDLIRECRPSSTKGKNGWG